MNRLFLFLLTLLLSVSNRVGAQEITVELDSVSENRVVTNQFRQNWELSLGLQGLSFYSNQENGRSFSQNPFKDYRLNAGISMSLTKWFSPELGLRVKTSGLWGKDISSERVSENAIRLFSLQGQATIDLTNIIYGYDVNRNYGVFPYVGVGMARNFTKHLDALVLTMGTSATYRLSERFKAYADLGFYIAGDEIMDGYVHSNNIFADHDRWFALEIGLIYELGTNRWKRVGDIVPVTFIPYEDVNRKTEVRTDTKVTVETVDEYPDVSVFFDLNSSVLTNRGQLENIRKLADVAKTENRTIVVTGYADSQTGNEQNNSVLSERRAETMRVELMNMGVPSSSIRVMTGGGVNTLNPAQANRRVVISLQ